MSFRRPCLDCKRVTAPGQSRCSRCRSESEALRRKVRGATPHADRLAAKVRAANWWDCEECGLRVLSAEVDHVVPLSDGGVDVPSNLQVLCQRCHRLKTGQENGGRRARLRRFLG